jgi:multidrug resistance efflux pump
VAAQEVDDALARDRSAAAQVDAAKSAVAAAQGQLGVSRANNLRVSSLVHYATITAPFRGEVTMRYADTGSLIPAGTSENGAQAVVRLAQSDVLRLRMPIPEQDVPLVHVGSMVTIHVQATGQQFPGSVISLQPGSLECNPNHACRGRCRKSRSDAHTWDVRRRYLRLAAKDWRSDRTGVRHHPGR